MRKDWAIVLSILDGLGVVVCIQHGWTTAAGVLVAGLLGIGAVMVPVGADWRERKSTKGDDDKE